MKKIWFLVLALWGTSAFAQSNGFIDGVLGGDGITAGDAAYLVLVASDNIGDDADPGRAFQQLTQLGWVPDGIQAESKITHAQYSFLLMKAFGMKGGALYSLIPSPRYAYRELQHLVVIQGAADPDMPVSGTQAMRMIGRMFDVKGIKQ